jgi:hypothetical protein
MMASSQLKNNMKKHKIAFFLACAYIIMLLMGIYSKAQEQSLKKAYYSLCSKNKQA